MVLFTPNNFAIEKGIIWFVPFSDKAICGYSINEKQFVYFKEIPEIDNGFGIFRNIVASNGKLFLIPFDSEKLYIYDINNDNFIAHDISDGKEKNNFYASVEYDNNLYVFPLKKGKVIKINTKNNGMNKLDCLEDIMVNRNDICEFGLSYCKLEDEIILLSRKKKEVYIFNFITENFKKMLISESKGYFDSVLRIDNENLLFSDNKGNFVYYNLKEHELTEKENKIEDFISHRYEFIVPNFSELIMHENIIYGFPGLANKIVEMEANCGEIVLSDWKLEIESGPINEKVQMFSNIKKNDGKAYGFWVSRGMLIEIDFLEKKISQLPYNYSDSFREKLKMYSIQLYKETIIHEGESLTSSLSFFLNSVGTR